MLPNIPNGFIELVKLVDEQRPRPRPGEVSNKELWDRFCYCALVGPDRVEAETCYVYNLLSEEGMLTRKKVREYGWVSEAEDTLNNTLKKIRGSAKDKKRAIIKKVLARILKLHETLAKADEVFNKLDITPPTLKKAEKEGNIGEILSELVYVGEAIENPNKIPDVGYTKAVLWLHGCGVGKDYAPDNNHTIRFLNECGYGASKWQGDSYVRKDYYILMDYLKKLRNMVNKKTSKEYSVADVAHAIFYYESTKSLIGNKYKKYYDPATLLSFLEKKKWTINKLADNWLLKIERLDELREKLENFISDTFEV